MTSYTVADYLTAVATSGTSGEPNTIADVASAIASLTPAQISELAGNGVTSLVAITGVLPLSVAQYSALGTVGVSASGGVVLSDSTENLDAMSAAEFGELTQKGISAIDVDGVGTMGGLAISAEKAIALGGLAFGQEDSIVLADSAGAINALTPAQIAALSASHVDYIDANGIGPVELSEAQLAALGTVQLAPSDIVSLKDTGANLLGLSVSEILALSSKFVDRIDASDGNLPLSLNQFRALLQTSVSLMSSDMVTIRDSGSNLAGLTNAELQAFATRQIDRIDATDDVLSLTAAQYRLLTGITTNPLTATDIVTIKDSGANLASFSTAELSALAGKNVDKLDASDDSLTLSEAQYLALGNVGLSASDAVTVALNSGTIGLSATAISALGNKNVDLLDIAGAASAATLTAGQAKALANSLGYTKFVSDDVVTLADAASSIQALTATEIAALAARNIDAIDETGNNALSLNLAQFNALGKVSLTASDEITIADAGTSFSAMTTTDLAKLAAGKVDVIDDTSAANAITFNIAQGLALGTVKIAASDAARITDTGSAFSTLSAAQIAALQTSGFDLFDASDDVLVLNKAQFDALGNLSVAENDVVTLSLQTAEMAALSAADIAAAAARHVDYIHAVGGSATLSAVQAAALGSIKMQASDTVTLLDAGSNIASLSATVLSQLSANGIDAIDASDNELNLTYSQLNAIPAGVQLTATDRVTVSLSQSDLASVSMAGVAAKGVDVLAVNGGSGTLNATQALALGNLVMSSADAITLSDAGATIASLTTAQIGALASHGIDAIDASNNELSLSLAQYKALGNVALTSADSVTLADTASSLEAMSVTDIASLGAKGVDVIDASDNHLTLTAAKLAALGNVALTEADQITLRDSGTALANLALAQIKALESAGLDAIDVSNNMVALDLPKALAFADVLNNDGISFAADTVVLQDTGDGIATLTIQQIAELVSAGFNQINATDGSLQLTVTQALAWAGSAVISSADQAVLADTGASLAALSPGQIQALATLGIDKVDATNNHLQLSLSQVRAFQDNGIALDAGDSVSLVESGAALSALSVASLLNLTAAGVDVVDASDNALTISLSQFNVLGTVKLASNDTVTIMDTGTVIGALQAAQIAALSVAGVDMVKSSSDLTLTAGQFKALGSLGISAAGVISLADSGSAIAGLSTLEMANLSTKGFTQIHATDGALQLSASLAAALADQQGAVAIAASDIATITDSGTNIAALSVAQIGNLAKAGIDAIDASDAALTLSKAQFDALGQVTLAAGDAVTVAYAAPTAINAADFAKLSAQNVDFIDVAGSDSWALNASQARALGAVKAATADKVTLADTAAAVSGLSTAEFAALKQNGIDAIDLTDTGTLVLSAATLGVLNGIAFASDDSISLVDSGTSLAAMTASQLAALRSAGVDRIDASNNVLNFSFAQFDALGTVALTGSDKVTVFDTVAHFNTLSAAQLSRLSLSGVDYIDLSENAQVISGARSKAMGNLGFAAADVVTLQDTAANISAFQAADYVKLAAQGVDRIDATDNSVTVTAGKFKSIGSMTFTAADTVKLADTGANVASLTAAQLASLGTKFVDSIDATDNKLTFSVAQYAALSKVAIAANDVVTVNGSAAVDVVTGRAGVDFINGAAGNDTINGVGGNDTLNGGDGNDRIIGGAGADKLIGGNGADTFVYQSAADSAGTLRDTIAGFVAGQDRIDLSAIDANAGTAGKNDSFAFLTSPGAAFTAPGQLHFTQTGSTVVIEGNTDADAAAEFSIVITGWTGAINASSFIL